MKFHQAVIPAGAIWSSPFVRWQGSLAEFSSLDVAAAVTRAALSRRGLDEKIFDGIVLGITIPQPGVFYGAPWLASRIGLAGLTGPMIAQACATSVAAVVAAAQQVEATADAAAQLVVATDRTSNGPLLVYPGAGRLGGSPVTEHWVLDNFAADPNTAESMVQTAEHVAREGSFDREALDALTLLRWEQYRGALADDRAIQRRYFEPVELPRGRHGTLVVEADEGVHPTTAEGLAALRPVRDGGVVTFGTQTHPADGCAGAVVCRLDRVATVAGSAPVARLLSAGVSRVEKARMPKAATTAALAALADAGVAGHDLAVVVTHNPFAVNDLWLSQQTGIPLERMNPYGSSLIYGHPQGPTGLRGIAELIQALVARGGGLGLFTGCAAGDTGAALVVRVD